MSKRDLVVEGIIEFLKENGGATLRGRFFDVSRDEGKREFAEWFADNLFEMKAWSDR